MTFSDTASKRCKLIKPFFMLVGVATVFIIGCGAPAPHVAIPYLPPDEFSDSDAIWQRSSVANSKVDNQRIGKFFKLNPDLIGSPDWTGEPEKYACKASKSIERFYWFSGNHDNPTWNAVEFEGSRMRELSGIGPPGTHAKPE